MPSLTDTPFAVLSFLAAPAILTNASTVLALGTSNRLARAADRARMLSGQILEAADCTSAITRLRRADFEYAIQRAALLVRALRLFYLAAGSFAAATCVALLGATAGYFGLDTASIVGAIATSVIAIVAVAALVLGSIRLVGETRIAIRVLDDEEAAIAEWAKRIGER